MTDASKYEAGQIWEYRTRSGEEASLLKIQDISYLPTKAGDLTVYHSSIVEVRIGPEGKFTEISHVPLSVETLDLSVTALSPMDRDFPDPAEGMGIWREDQGGVFTLPVAEIVGLFDEIHSREQ